MITNTRSIEHKIKQLEINDILSNFGRSILNISSPKHYITQYKYVIVYKIDTRRRYDIWKG